MRSIGFWLASLALGVTSARRPEPEPALPRGAQAAPVTQRWFEGTFDDALARARVERRPIVLVFVRKDCPRCDELVRVTFADPAVFAEFADDLCLSLDAQHGAVEALAARFGITEHPTIVWLSPDGTLRDRIVGAPPANELARQARRVRADHETIAELRARVAANESDVEVRWRLAQKLRAAGDGNGAAEQIERIKKLDPDGRSKPMRLMRLDDVRNEVRRTYDEARGAFDTSSLAALLARESDPDVLFRGWSIVADFEAGALARIQQAHSSTPEQAAAARGRRRTALRAAWPHCPYDECAKFGNDLAWSFYECSEELDDAERRFALDVAERAVERAGELPALLDTLACCLFMNGRLEEAKALERRCVELDPKNETWQTRLAEFGS